MGANESGASSEARIRLTDSGPPLPADAVADAYARGGDADIGALAAELGVSSDDDALSDLIHADGQERLSLRLPITLDRYLRQIPYLRERPCALDTAIEMTLQRVDRDSGPRQVESLIEAHPDLRSQIQASAIMNELVPTTPELSGALLVGNRALPRSFGPAGRDGAPRYELRELIGQGSQGVVYLGTDRSLSEPDRPAWVAIKVLLKRSRARSATVLDEATKARRVDHPNVVRVLDCGVADDGEQFIVYEHVRGGDLDAYVKARSGRLSQQEAATILAAIGEGLQAAHAAGLAHCDLKPGNVLVTDTGVPRVADFGIAVRIDGTVNPRSPSYLGSLAFTAPEQFRDEPGAGSPLADIYAAGGLLYWLLSGEYPNGKTVSEIHRNLSLAGGRMQPPSLAAYAGVDPDLSAIAARAMHPQSSQRYQSAGAMAQDLEDWLELRPLRWRRYSLPRRAMLFARREPRAAVAMLVLLTMLVVSGATGVYLDQAGKRRVIAAELEKSKEFARERDERLRSAQLATNSLIRALRTNTKEEDFLPLLTALESMAGPLFFALETDKADLWTPRSKAVERHLKEAERQGRMNDLEILIWQGVYGYWQLKLDNLEEARVVLTDNLKRLQAFCPNDPWLHSVEAMLACLDAKDAMKLSGKERDKAMAAAAQKLEPFGIELGGLRVGRMIERYVLTTKLELYGVNGLNRPDDAARARAALKAVQ